MYDLHLTPEQIEFRDAVRDFVEREVKPAATAPARLEPFEKPLMTSLLEQAAQMGLRGLGLSEDAGGAGADTLTACMLLEELAAGDVDLAVVLGETALLARVVLGDAMNVAQRGRWLPRFLADDGFHMALMARDDAAERGWSYRRPSSPDADAPGIPGLTAVREGRCWIVSGRLPFVPNAPVAGLFIVQAVAAATSDVVTLLLPRDAPGLAVEEAPPAFAADGMLTRWHHGAVAPVTLRGCRVADEDVLEAAAVQRMQADLAARHAVQRPSISALRARLMKPQSNTRSCAGRAGGISSGIRPSA